MTLCYATVEPLSLSVSPRSAGFLHLFGKDARVVGKLSWLPAKDSNLD